MKFKVWEKISSTEIFQNDYWSYRVDEFCLDSLFFSKYHYVHTHGSTMIIPKANDGKFILVEQFRYLNQKNSIELPCGGVKPNLSYEENAHKELREETGYDSHHLKYIGEFSPFTGAADEICKVFLADNLYLNPLAPDKTEEFKIHFLTYSEINDLISSNIIWDGLTLAAWALFDKHKGNLNV